MGCTTVVTRCQWKPCENLPQWDLLSLKERVTSKKKRGLLTNGRGFEKGGSIKKGSRPARASSYMR